MQEANVCVKKVEWGEERTTHETIKEIRYTWMIFLANSSLRSPTTKESSRLM